MTRALLGFHGDDRYRTVPETRLIDMIYLAGWSSVRASVDRDVARQALEGWVGLGLNVRRGDDGGRLFDPAEVLNFAKQAGLDGRDGFWPGQMVKNARRLVEDFRAENPSHFTLELKRSFNTHAATPGQALRLRLPLPLESDHLDGLEVTPFADQEARLTVTRGRLEARLPSTGQEEVVIGAKVTFSARAQTPDPAPLADAAPYLKPHDGLIVVSNRVADLAQSLAGPGTSPLASVRAFWDYCLDTFRQGAVHYDQIDVTAPGDWLLDTGWGDCQLVGALFCALCRARGIPARLLGGFYLYRTCSTNHYWVEAWIDGQGWLPFDFLCWELSLGGRDAEWRDHFFGRLDARLTNQCLPFDFTGAVGVPLPAAWHIVQWPTSETGVAIGMLDSNARPLYADFISVAYDSKAP